VRHMTASSLAAFALIASASLACGPAAACPQPQTAKDAPSSPHGAQVVGELKFDWPVPGWTVIECWTENKERITVAAGDGALVRAAQSGLVVYAGELKRYGSLVLIRHAQGFVSAIYGAIGDLRVKRNDVVEKGQPVAVIRTSDRFPEAKLRFELRRGAEWVDPRAFMISPEPAREDPGGLVEAR